MRLDLQVSNTSGLVANLYAADARIQRGIRALNRVTAADAQSIAKQLCPKDTTYMSSKVRKDFSDEGLRWSIGWRREDFEGVVNPVSGKVMTFYPPYVELGTFSSPAQPTLGPTMAAVETEYRVAMRALVRNAFDRRRRAA